MSGGPLEVNLVSGMSVSVLTDEEVKWFNQTRDDYTKQLKFTETTDLRDLDRLLVHELMIFRWTQWLASGLDYDGDMLGTNAPSEEQLRKNIKEFSDQINKIKESMGLNKKARDAAAAEGSFNQWLVDLKARAKAFGVHRENQLTAALVIMKELAAVVRAFYRAEGDDEELKRLGFENEAQIVEWIRDILLPEFDDVDTYFRTHIQRYWIRDM